MAGKSFSMYLLFNVITLYFFQFFLNFSWFFFQDPTFAIFMCLGDLLLLLLMWGISIHVWKSAGIDYLRLLDLQGTELAHTKSPAQMVLNAFANMALFFLIVFILFNKLIRALQHQYLQQQEEVDDGFHLAMIHSIPVLFALYFAYRITIPWETRQLWWWMLWKVLAAPFYSIDFCAGYIGDLLTSLVRVMIPFVFSWVYVILSIYAWLTNQLEYMKRTDDRWWTTNLFFTQVIVPVLTLLPLWIRLVQCLRRSVETGHRWPHYGNALKYTSAMAVIAHGTFQPKLRDNMYWIIAFISATIFQFLWDIFQDWGMVEIVFPSYSKRDDDNDNSGRNGLDDDIALSDSMLQRCWSWKIVLRKKRLLGPSWVYILIMIANLSLRFAWTLTLVPPEDDTEELSLYTSFVRHIGPVIAATEIVRRMVWGFFRLEWEQLTIIQKANQVMMEEQARISEEEEKEEEKGSSTVSVEDIESTVPIAKVNNDIEPLELEENEEEDDSLLPTKRERKSLQQFQLPRSSSFPLADDWFDWTVYIPYDWLETILHLFPRTWNFESKLRFIESIVFATLVFSMLGIAACPLCI
jgi:hypothetical protein